MKKEILISVDVEADGPIPGEYSMTSFGACPALLRSEDGKVVPLNVDEDAFYAELKPISKKWDPEALAIGGLSREHFETKGQDPQKVMPEFDAWVKKIGKKHSARPVAVGYPIVYDWQWIYWYLIKFNGASPFGFSGAVDLKTLVSIKSNRILAKSTKRNLPKHLFGKRPHTHNALDDAREQADFCINLFNWSGK